MIIKEIILKEWKDLEEFEPEAGTFIYRGHSNSSWELNTSLARIVHKNQIGYRYDETNILYAERAGLKTFKSRAHFYLNNLPNLNDSISWLSLMQHHGTPTRLIDFTRSLYIALYFALIDAETESCVWVIDDGWILHKGADLAIELGFNSRDGLRFGDLESMYNAANYVISQNKFTSDEDFKNKGVFMIEIEKQNPRLAIQQGLFLMPLRLTESFIENLSEMKPNSDYSIQKIIIPHERRCHFLMHLRTMNITAETLFPGIDGFAKSIIQLDMI